MLVHIKKGRYLIVPSTYKRPTKEELELGAGPFHLSVFGCAEEGNGLESWELIDAEALNLENKENNIQGQQEHLSSTQNLEKQQEKDSQLKKDILYENVREKIIALSKKRNTYLHSTLYV